MNFKFLKTFNYLEKSALDINTNIKKRNKRCNPFLNVRRDFKTMNISF